MTNPENVYLAIKAEKEGRWEDAVLYWKKCGEGYEFSVNACQMIIDAKAQGDLFRENNESCPVCQVVSEKSLEQCPHCKVIKSLIREQNERQNL